ncbi:uncharacterized protein LOC121010836 [Herpailurus yagouaroundi]|uniref:uncharacterized protein LOC121010836 n=1 Tax=Herpailurus yagouaroundi TaxID=1608482 RepID=UPI001AD6BFA4|nr:uncharacterized protein LOC121010836 [Puma yagouaroundi]
MSRGGVKSRVDAKCKWEGCFAPSEGGLDFHIGETTKSFIEEIPDETIIIGAGGGGECGTRPWGGESQLFQSREQPVSPRAGVGRVHATSRSSDLQETTGRSCMTSSGGVPAGHPRARHVRGSEGPRGQGPNEITKRSRSREKTSNFYEILTMHTVINCCHNTLDYGSNPGRTRRADSDLCSFHTARRDLQNGATLAQDPNTPLLAGPWDTEPPSERSHQGSAPAATLAWMMSGTDESAGGGEWRRGGGETGDHTDQGRPDLPMDGFQVAKTW